MTIDQLHDLVTTSQKELGEMKFTMLGFDLQSYPGWSEIFAKNKVKIDSGTSVQWNVKLGLGTNGRWVGAFAEDQTTIPATHTTMEVPWKRYTNNYSIELPEVMMNRGKRKIVDLTESRRLDCVGEQITDFESSIWSAPNASDEFQMWGIPYYNVKWPTGSATVAFTGQNPTGFSTVAGKDSSSATYAKWRNCAGQYTNFTKADVIEKMLRMQYLTDFKSPVRVPSYQTGNRLRKTIDMNYTTYAGLRAIGEDVNENIGKDLAMYDGQLTFHKHPIRVVPQLEADTSNPIYFNNWSVMNVKFLSGMWLREATQPAHNQHLVVTTHIDTICQLWCADRRYLGVLSQLSLTGTST